MAFVLGHPPVGEKGLNFHEISKLLMTSSARSLGCLYSIWREEYMINCNLSNKYCQKIMFPIPGDSSGSCKVEGLTRLIGRSAAAVVVRIS